MTKKTIEINCDNHGKQTVSSQWIGLLGKWSEPTCQKCLKYNSQKETDLEKQKKLDQENKLRKVAIGNAGIPLRFKDHSFNTFKVTNEEQGIKLGRCEEYAKNFSQKLKNGTSMIFCGKTGTGKTHLACSIANEIILKGNNAVFMNVLKMMRQVKDTWSSRTGKKEQEAIDWFLKPDLLILDEVGVQFGSDAEKMILFEILNERYQNMKPTILISNLLPANLQEYVGERVMDRMKENGGRILQFEGKSSRDEKSKALLPNINLKK